MPSVEWAHLGPPPAGGDLDERVRHHGPGRTVVEAMRVIGGCPAEDVHADAVPRPGAADAVPAVVGRQQVGDVARGPPMTTRLHRRAARLALPVARLLVRAVEVADDAPAALMVGAALGLEPGALWVKRDDCTGLAGGGNKARKLEYLCAEAIADGCDTLVTGGGRQSNHVRMTVAAANRLGLGCTVVLAGGRPSRPTGNVLLDYLLGADVVWIDDAGYYATEAAIDHTCARLRADGRRPYAMPIGGASVTGALGYVAAADELVGQLPDVDLVVTADGSGGTHAGLVAGLGDHERVLGVDVGTRP